MQEGLRPRRPGRLDQPQGVETSVEAGVNVFLKAYGA
jgi:hypothetical protein